MELIIGLIGAKGAGKTTALEFIQELEPEVSEITLAAALKEVCAKVSDIPISHFSSHQFKEALLEVPFVLSPPVLRGIFEYYNVVPDFDKHIRPHIGKALHTPRQIAQYVGTEVLRSFDYDIHCKRAVSGKDGLVGVVTDIRFPNELEYFQNMGVNFYPIYIKNTGAEINASSDTHASEAHLKTISRNAIEVPNETTIAEFKKKIQTQYLAIRKGQTPNALV